MFFSERYGPEGGHQVPKTKTAQVFANDWLRACKNAQLFLWSTQRVRTNPPTITVESDVLKING